jgi:hypothetical protein
MSDTVICVKVARQAQTQVAAFSYSSPSGAPAFVSEVRQYNENCELIEIGSMIDSGTDSITVCYDVQTDLIDNFCPYMVLSGGLAVAWGGISAYFQDVMHVRFITLSNSGTKEYHVIWSQDAVNWRTVLTLDPLVETTSTVSDYNNTVNAFAAGDNYYAIKEVDLNGRTNVSDIVYVNVPFPSVSHKSQYDILGRVGSNTSYDYYIQPR